jgi:hypothetical protein
MLLLNFCMRNVLSLWRTRSRRLNSNAVQPQRFELKLASRIRVRHNLAVKTVVMNIVPHVLCMNVITGSIQREEEDLLLILCRSARRQELGTDFFGTGF